MFYDNRITDLVKKARDLVMSTKVHPEFVEMRKRELANSQNVANTVRELFKNPRGLKIKSRKKTTK